MTTKELKDGRYALIRKLGEGSQGETYEAMDNGVGTAARAAAERNVALADKWQRYVREQESGGEVPRDAKLVAIKCFRVSTAKAWKDVELAEREARTLASLDHPRLPKYFEHFEEDGALYLVMEKIEGESLATIRANKRAMSAADVTRMLEDVGDALHYLHGRAPAVVHRDIKPGNILRRPDGSFALVDFGAVRDRLKPAGGSTVVGTFGYMAPEQFQGRASSKSDVYGLGATALTMLTGVEPEELPHAGLGIDVARALPESTPSPLVRALTAMLVPDPDARVATVDEALAILHAAEAKRPVEESPRVEAPRLVPMVPGASSAVRPQHPFRPVAFVAMIAAWAAVYFGQRHGHHTLLWWLAIAAAVALTTYIRRTRQSTKRTSRPSEAAAAPKVRVAAEPERIRAASSDERRATPEPEEEPEEESKPEPRQQRRRR